MKLVWGDSHAAHYFYGMEDAGRRQGFIVSEAALSGCLPLLGPVTFLLRECQQFNSRILDLIARNRPDEVVISGHWNKYYQRDADALFAAIDQTARLLSKRHIRLVFVGPSIEYQDRLPILITRAWAKDRGAPLALSNQLSPGIFDLDRKLNASLSSIAGVTYVSVLASICPRDSCPPLVDDKTPMVWDTAHLTAAGSQYVVQRAFATVK
jgi:hypothetical protein